MKKWFRNWYIGPKDIIAFMLVGAYCVAFLITVCVPEIKYNQQMGAEFSKLMTLVVGFYFVTHKERATNADRQVQQDTCQDCERGKTDVL